MIDVKVPELGESIQEATILSWLKNSGDIVNQDEAIAELETEKAALEIYSPSGGILESILKKAGDNVAVNEVIAKINDTGGEPAKALPERQKPGKSEDKDFPPSVRRLLEENNLDPLKITGTGKRGQLTKEDIINFMEEKPKKEEKENNAKINLEENRFKESPQTRPREEIVPMSRLRQTIARRLIEAQQNAAILTTFNEVDMTNVMDLRKKYKQQFFDKHNVNLGFMSFFAKAVIDALLAFPAVNAEIRGNNIVYKYYYDIGIAVGGPRGLVVPVIKDIHLLGFPGIEKKILDMAARVKDGTISLEEMTGGTFTISNGGVYGSLMSTPILNPPQSAILGMHKISNRPVVIGDEIKIRPMMYLALSYDHRIVDGREAVQFLVKIKENIEDPTRLLLGV